MVAPLVRRFAEVLGPLEPAELPAAVRAEVQRAGPAVPGRGVAVQEGPALPAHGRDVRIAGGVNVLQRVHKAPGGLLRATLELKDGRLEQVSLSGDFFCYPQNAVEELERRLTGAPLEKAGEVLESFYATRVEIPGVTIADWLGSWGWKPQLSRRRPMRVRGDKPGGRGPYRRSRQRERILELLQATGAHPTADWLYGRLRREFPRLSMGTVYRNIGILIEQGRLSRIAFGSTFDRLDANLQPHYHFLCERCDAIIDLDLPVEAEHRRLARQGRGLRGPRGTSWSSTGCARRAQSRLDRFPPANR